MLQLTHLLEENTHFRKQMHGLDAINENKKHFIESQMLEMETYMRTYVAPYQYSAVLLAEIVMFYGRRRNCHCIQQAKVIFKNKKSCCLYLFFS